MGSSCLLRPQIWRAIVLVCCLLTLFGCTTPRQAASPPTPPDGVRVQLAWIHSIEYAGFYMAQARGIYAAQNLAVTLDVLGNETPIDVVTSGKAQFGITSADTILRARAEGKPVVAIATIYQRSPVAFISLAQQHITRPQDFIGKTVMVDLKGTTAIVYRALLAEQGIDETQVHTQPRTDYTNDALVQGKVDVLDAFINNQPVQLRQQGHAITAILPSDYGIDLYANVIFTTEDLIAKQPALVERFVRATVQGMQQAIDTPAEAVTLAVSQGKDLNQAAEAESMRYALPLMSPAGSRPGMMTDTNWQKTFEILRNQNILPQQVDVTKAYTLSFLTRAYTP